MKSELNFVGKTQGLRISSPPIQIWRAAAERKHLG